MSAVDIAVWDALGKVKQEPVYNLLGGKTKDKLPVQMTNCDPKKAKEMGQVGGKIPLPHGPGDGREGFARNIEQIAGWREKVGTEFPLMIDCYMSLNVEQTIRLAQEIVRKDLGVLWMEECLMPDDYDGWRQVKLRVPDMTFTTGEHEQSRQGFRQLLQDKCIDVIQPDITWCGGITEARRIVALASSYDIPVIPHGSGPYSYHLQIAFPNCPIAELINLSPKGDKTVPLFGDIFLNEPLPIQGQIDLDSNAHGFGLNLNPNQEIKRPFIRN